MSTGADNWDQHWAQLGATAELGPTPKYRRRLIWKLLDIHGRGESVRMVEIGSGTGEFAAEFCARYPRSSFLGLELSKVGVEAASRRDLLRISGNATCCYLPEPTRLWTSAPHMLCARKFLSISKNLVLFCGMLLHTCKPAVS